MGDKLTAQEAADELGYHVNHIYRLLKEGFLYGEQFNGVWMIPKSEVRRVKALQSESGRLPKGTVTPS